MLRIGVTVRPAFHQTVWFRVIVVAGLLALVYGGYRMRVRQLEARGRMLQRLVDERTAELAEKNRQLESAYARIEEASLTDPLTGLRNRRYLEQTIGADLELALRRSRDEADRDALPLLVFLLVDLDHFKSVNDTYGHAAGDAVLRQTAEVLRAAFRASDHVVRWGGEEFLVVARFVHAFEGAAFGEKLRAAIEQREYVLPDGRTIGRSCSIGFAAFPFLPSDPRGVDWHDVVDIADAALYAVKRSGRNGWAGIWPVDASVDVSAVRLLRDDRAAAAASGAFRVEVREELGAGFRWD
jgi:diguanylate cyclase (GGDEF)-like protein